MSANELLKGHPLAAVGLSAVTATEGADGSAELQQFESAIRDYSLNRTGVDWALVERLGSIVAAQRCDLKVYSYLSLAAFCAAADEHEASPYLALGAALHALGDVIEKGWERCLPRLPARRQAQLKWLSEELCLPLKARPPRPAELPAFLTCLAEAERVAELSGQALSLGYPLLRELREVLAAHKPESPPAAAPAPAAQPPSPPALPTAKAEPTPAVQALPKAMPPPAAPTPEPKSVAASQPATPKHDEKPTTLSKEALEDSLAELVTLVTAQMRSESLLDPTPYWLLRALRWSTHDLLRPERVQEVVANQYQTVLPPHPDHKNLLRQFAARLADGQYADVLAECEELFGTYPLWLDLQRFTAAALDALDATTARQVLRSEMRLLLARCPEITRFRFGDREATPLAHSDTVSWLQEELGHAGANETKAAAPKSIDSTFAMSEDLDPGVRKLQTALATAKTGQERFELRLALGEFLLGKQRSDIAMPIAQALLASARAHRLGQWQPELFRRALSLAVRTARAAELGAPRRAALWRRLCQFSPETALLLGPEIPSD